MTWIRGDYIRTMPPDQFDPDAPDAHSRAGCVVVLAAALIFIGAILVLCFAFSYATT